MSAYTVDISKHLEDTVKLLKIGPNKDDVLEVDDDKNTVLKIQEILNKENTNEGIEKALKLAVGEKGFEKINSMKISYTDYQNIFIGVMAAISAKTFEETEKQFRKSEQV